MPQQWTTKVQPVVEYHASHAEIAVMRATQTLSSAVVSSRDVFVSTPALAVCNHIWPDWGLKHELRNGVVASATEADDEVGFRWWVVEDHKTKKGGVDIAWGGSCLCATPATAMVPPLSPSHLPSSKREQNAAQASQAGAGTGVVVRSGAGRFVASKQWANSTARILSAL